MKFNVSIENNVYEVKVSDVSLINRIKRYAIATKQYDHYKVIREYGEIVEAYKNGKVVPHTDIPNHVRYRCLAWIEPEILKRGYVLEKRNIPFCFARLGLQLIGHSLPPLKDDVFNEYFSYRIWYEDDVECVLHYFKGSPVLKQSFYKSQSFKKDHFQVVCYDTLSDLFYWLCEVKNLNPLKHLEAANLSK